MANKVKASKERLTRRIKGSRVLLHIDNAVGSTSTMMGLEARAMDQMEGRSIPRCIYSLVYNRVYHLSRQNLNLVEKPKMSSLISWSHSLLLSFAKMSGSNSTMAELIHNVSFGLFGKEFCQFCR